NKLKFIKGFLDYSKKQDFAYSSIDFYLIEKLDLSPALGNKIYDFHSLETRRFDELNGFVNHSLARGDSNILSLQDLLSVHKDDAQRVSTLMLQDSLKRLLKSPWYSLKLFFVFELSHESIYFDSLKVRAKRINEGYETIIETSKLYDLEVENLLIQTHRIELISKYRSLKPFLSHNEVELIRKDYAEYILTDKVKISVKMKYNPKEHSSKRYDSLLQIYKTNAKKIKNKEELIKTLKSIQEHDLYEPTQICLNTMITNYEKFGHVNPGQELQDMVNV
ncbi:hypothetical protein HN814_01495, partial [Candidatus Woesearchaeota archaeon]|nr:hypothetical protein [Candidatus Woesearchaeota archaeon]